MKASPRSHHDVLAIHSGALGDVLLFGRLLAMLPGEVTLVAGGEKGRLLAGLGAVRRAIDFDGLPMHEVFGDKAADRCRLPAMLGTCDRLVSCFGADNPRAQMRLGSLCGAASAAFLPVRPPEECRCHLVELWADMLGLDVAPADLRNAWPVPPAWRQGAGEALAQAGLPAGGPYVVIHPGSGGVAKCWPTDRFAEVARRLGERARPVFVLGPAELDRWEGGQIASLAASFPVVQSPSLPALAGILAGAAGYLGNDSGVSHLAAAVGTPTVALFGPSRADHFGPLGPCAKTIQQESMSQIGVGDAMSALEAVLHL